MSTGVELNLPAPKWESAGEVGGNALMKQQTPPEKRYNRMFQY